MGAFPSHSAPSGYSQEISLKKKSLALMQSSHDTSSQPTSPRPQPYPQTYTISSASPLPTSPTAAASNVPNLANSPSMSDSQCTSDSPRTSDFNSTPGASSSNEGEGEGEATVSNSPASKPTLPSSASEATKSATPIQQPLTVKTGTKRAAPSP